MNNTIVARETKVVREEIEDLRKYLIGIPEHLRKGGAFDAYDRRLIQLTREFFEGQEFKDKVIREEIEDLKKYLTNIPEYFRKNGAFDSYDQRLIILTKELFENQEFKDPIILEEVKELQKYLTNIPGHLKKSGTFGAYERRLIQLAEELFEKPEVNLNPEKKSLTSKSINKPIKNVLDLTGLANLENSIIGLTDIIIACHQVEQPRGLLLEAVENNMAKGIRYTFLVSRGNFNTEKESYYQIFHAIAKIVSVKHQTRRIEELIRIKPLRTEWATYPNIFYKTHKDLRNVEATLVYRGTEVEKGICTKYHLVEPEIAPILYDLLVASVDWSGDMQKEIMSLVPSEFISPEEYASRFL